MNEKKLYKASDEFIGHHLKSSYNFETKQEGEYIRKEINGYDRVLIDPASSKNQFSVMMCFYPQYLSPIYELIEASGEDQGFPCGPYLSPVNVSQREKFWSCKNQEKLKKSINHIIDCIDNIGIPWLQTLRMPDRFAHAVDPNALLHAAFANEYVENYEPAKRCYLEILDRYKKIIDKYGTRSMTKFMKIEYIFVTAKLGNEDQYRVSFEKELNYKPTIKSLPV